MEQPTKEQISTWVTALRSGEYKQTQGYLQDALGYCCLGVACELFIPKEKQVITMGAGRLFGSNPDQQPNAPTWLQMFPATFGLTARASIVAMNDQGVPMEESVGTTTSLLFDEIADVLEAVYILEVLND